LAFKLAGQLDDCIVYLPDRLRLLEPHDKRFCYFSDWNKTITTAFTGSAALICIMAAGIVVRSLAPLLKSKFHDPAVVVVDEKGSFAVSLLSGHTGGANKLAGHVASLLGGQAVISTASDVNHKQAVDLLAREINAILAPCQRVKMLNRRLAEGETVNLYSPWPLIMDFGVGFLIQQWTDNRSEAEYESMPDNPYYKPVPDLIGPAVVISPWLGPALPDDCLQLLPRNLAVGIGCRRGVSTQEVEEAFSQVLKQNRLDPSCVVKMATVDIKSDEPALQEFALKRGMQLLTFSREEIETLEGVCTGSPRLKR
jgi:cobalt-precorrin 5A hydrolase